MDRQSLELLLLLYIVPVVLVLDHAAEHVAHHAAGWRVEAGLEGDLRLPGTPALLEEDLLQPRLGAEGALAVGHPVAVGLEGPIEVRLVAHQQAQLLLGDLLLHHIGLWRSIV